MTGDPETDRTDRRPRWRKKRWWVAAVVLLLAVGYPATAGPAAYACARGWPLSLPLLRLYKPLWPATVGDGPLSRAYKAYSIWWAKAAAGD